jgi:hypothetical protein
MSSLGLESAAMSDPASKVIALNIIFFFINEPLIDGFRVAMNASLPLVTWEHKS